MLSESCWAAGPLAAPNGSSTEDVVTMVVMLMSTDEKLRYAAGTVPANMHQPY